MKNTFGKIAVASAMALGLGIGSTAALAATADLGPNVTAKKFTSALSTSGKALAAVTAAQSGTFTYTLAGAATSLALNTGDVLTFTLAGGAKFDSTTLQSQLSNGTLLTSAASVSDATALVQGDCKLSSGSTVFTCTLTSASKATAYQGLSLTGVKYDLSAATADTTLTVTHDSTVFGTATTLASSTKTSKLADSTIFTVKAAVADGGKVDPSVKSDTITVASSFIKLKNATNNVSASTNTAGTDFAVALDVTGVTAKGNYLFAVTGLPSAATKVVYTGGGLTASDSAGGTTNITATNSGTFYLDGAGNGYAIVAANTVATIPLSTKGLIIEVDGKTALTNATVKLGITYIAGTSDDLVAHTVMAPSDVLTLTRDGSTFRLNRIVTGSSLRLTNLDTGTAGGAITITAYDNKGATLTNAGTVALATTVAPGGNSVDILGSDLITDFGATIDHIQVTVEATSVEGSLTHAITGLGFSTTVGTTSSGTTVDL